MKKSLIATVLLLFLIGISGNSQRWNSGADSDYRNYDNYASHFHSDRHFSYAYSGKSHRNQLSRKDKKHLARLQKDLDKARHRAMRDGYISRNERRNINRIKSDIDRILNQGANHYHSRKQKRQGSRNCR